MGTHLGPSAETLQAQLRQSEAVHGDETGWWYLGESGWAWSFSDKRTSLFRLDKSRGHGVVLDVLGRAFGGCLISDFLGTYDPLPYRKGKCMAHLLKEIAEGSDKQAACFARRVKFLVKAAIVIKRKQNSFVSGQFEGFRDAIDVLCGCPLDGRMGKRKHLLTFLHDDLVDATNNQAERDIRPFVIFRKTCGGTRSQLGAVALTRLRTTS